jgi:putative ABC transport system permease protein
MTPWATITTPDKPFIDGAKYVSAYALMATPEIFSTLGVPIVRGRAFDARDDGTAPPVMVVSEFTARKIFGTADAIGRQLLVRVWGRPGQTYNVLGMPTGSPVLEHAADRAFSIVGIARDTDTGEATKRGDAVVYLPLTQHFERNVAILARTNGDPWEATRAIQLAVRRADPDLAIGTASPAWLMMSGEFFAARIAASFASALGLLTLLMSMVGLYGIQTHVVARRTREVGLRMAIGASAAQIRTMILGEGYRPVLQGLGLGLLFGVLVRLLLRATVNGNIDAFDPLAFAIVPLPLIAAAFVACYLPARRASRVDPNEALRHL